MKGHKENHIFFFGIVAIVAIVGIVALVITTSSSSGVIPDGSALIANEMMGDEIFSEDLVGGASITYYCKYYTDKAKQYESYANMYEKYARKYPKYADRYKIYAQRYKDYAAKYKQLAAKYCDDDVSTCKAGYQNQYQCSGKYSQRLYNNSDCSSRWINFKYCGFGCANGVCQNQTVNNQTCTDYDYGVNLYTKSYTSSSVNGTKHDTCYDNNYLLEAVCSSSKGAIYQRESCPDTCSNGKCVNNTISPVGSLYATSTPSTAILSIDMVHVSYTPHLQGNLSVGMHFVNISKYGYYDNFTYVYIQQGVTTILNASLRNSTQNGTRTNIQSKVD